MAWSSDRTSNGEYKLWLIFMLWHAERRSQRSDTIVERSVGRCWQKGKLPAASRQFFRILNFTCMSLIHRCVYVKFSGVKIRSEGLAMDTSAQVPRYAHVFCMSATISSVFRFSVAFKFRYFQYVSLVWVYNGLWAWFFCRVFRFGRKMGVQISRRMEAEKIFIMLSLRFFSNFGAG